MVSNKPGRLTTAELFDLLAVPTDGLETYDVAFVVDSTGPHLSIKDHVISIHPFHEPIKGRAEAEVATQYVHRHWRRFQDITIPVDEEIPGLRELPLFCPQLFKSTNDADLVQCWLFVVRLVEFVVTSKVSVPGDERRAARLLPLFERLWFLLLTMPFRSEEFNALGVIESSEFADPHEYSYGTRWTRDVWAERILNNEDNPLLSIRADGSWIEREAHLLVFNDAGVGGIFASKKKPFVPWLARSARIIWKTGTDLSVRSPNLLFIDTNHPADELRIRRSLVEQRQFIERIIREFFLRRIMIAEAWVVLKDKNSTVWCRGILYLCSLVLLFVGFSPLVIEQRVFARYLAAPALLGLLYPPVAFYLIAFGLLFWLILTQGIRYSYPYCLRLLGSSFLGVFALATLGSSWRSAPNLWLAAIPLTIASFAFLALQAKSHGASGGASVLRSLQVVCVGWCHSVGVTACALAFGFPGFYSKSFQHLSNVKASQVIILGAAIALSLGVFLQVLWEDRPATFPLGRLHWRGERT